VIEETNDMKRYIRSSTAPTYDFDLGDTVTVYNGTHGYANYDGEIVYLYINRYDVAMARVRSRSGDHDVALSSIIPSQRAYFYSLTINDVLTKDFISKMKFKDDSMWCDRVNSSRVDHDVSIENTVGYEAYIASYTSGYRVCITDYISKHYTVTREIEDESGLSVNDPMITEALDILKSAPEVVVNFAGYQRIFKK